MNISGKVIQECAIYCKKLALLSLLVVLAGFQTVAQMPHPSTGTMKRFEHFRSAFVDARNIDVWLPEGYSEKKKYAVLYMHDGQMLFDSVYTWNRQEWGVDEVMGDLIARRRIRNCIVVGIWNNGEYRHSEYFPQMILDQVEPGMRAVIIQRQLNGKPRADLYLRFIVEELKPFIDSCFSTRTNRSNTFVMGSSMGGLISIYALCQYPEIFGGAACLSIRSPVAAPSLIRETADTGVPRRLRDYLRDHLPKAASSKIYFDYGSETLASL